MSQIELGVIGGGNMAEAILGGVVKGGFLAPAQICVSDPSAARRDVISQLGVGVTEDNISVAHAKRLLLAVKPQVMASILEELRGHIPAETLILSIAAGLSTTFFAEWLGDDVRIIRIMPNTPMLVGEGASGVCGGTTATSDDLDWATQMLTSGGGMAIVVEEPLMDAVTAVSGSGPAYAFYLAENMIAAGRGEGLNDAQAKALAAQTLLGAGKLLAESVVSAEELRRRVTSPGGTTEQAIHTLDAHKVSEAIRMAVRAAAARSRELGQ